MAIGQLFKGSDWLRQPVASHLKKFVFYRPCRGLFLLIRHLYDRFFSVCNLDLNQRFHSA